MENDSHHADLLPFPVKAVEGEHSVNQNSKSDTNQDVDVIFQVERMLQ